jgi:hypothetical protein
MLSLSLLAAALAGFVAVPVRATDFNMVMTVAESPGATNSSLADTTVEDFNSFSQGDYTNVSTPIGTYDLLSIRNANEYGGAAGPGFPTGSPYAVTSASSSLGGIPTTTLTFSNPVSYFGLWWSAGDAANYLTFYDGSTEIAAFTTANLVDLLPNAYKGNPTPGPNHGADSNEKFAFLNFYGVSGTEFTSVVFHDPNTSGFENDNNTIRAAAYGSDTNDVSPYLPGVPVEEVLNTGGTQTTITNTADYEANIDPGAQLAPEPGVCGLLAAGALTGGVWLGRFRRQRG